MLPLRSSADTDGDVARLLGKLEANGSALTILRYVANATNAFRPFVLFSNALLNQSTLPRTSIEIVILHIAVVVDAPYEVAEHVPMARAAGLDQRTIDGVIAGDIKSVVHDDKTLTMIEVADALVSGRSIPDPLWAEMVEKLGTESAMELVLIVGWFAGTVRVVTDALGLGASR
jgi:4-carboxymuconolactone decarboxylase